MIGKIEEILICEKAGQELEQVKEALLIQGKGIKGDRYFRKDGTFSEALVEQGDFEVTLIENEEIDAFNKVSGLNYAPNSFRRNLITSGIRLNDLVGEEFRIGDTKLYGVRLCEPCAYLSNLLGKEVMDHMVHKAGLRAVIREGGDISVGCSVEPY